VPEPEKDILSGIHRDIEENGFSWPVGQELLMTKTGVRPSGGGDNHEVWTTLVFERTVVEMRAAEWCGYSKYGVEIRAEDRNWEEEAAGSMPITGPRGIGGVMDKEVLEQHEELRLRVEVLSAKQEMLRRAIETGTHAMTTCVKSGVDADKGLPDMVEAAVVMLRRSLDDMEGQLEL